MKVICVRIPTPVDGMELDTSPWVRLDAEYHVLSVSARPDGRVLLQILADDGRSLGLFKSDCFRVIDGSLPRSWTARLYGDGALEFAPIAWLADGFWELYYEADPTAVDAVERELRLIAGAAGA